MPVSPSLLQLAQLLDYCTLTTGTPRVQPSHSIGFGTFGLGAVRLNFLRGFPHEVLLPPVGSPHLLLPLLSILPTPGLGPWFLAMNTGFLDRASAITWFFPAIHSTVNSNPNSFDIKRCIWTLFMASKFLPFIIPSSGLWSVTTLNFVPARYNWHLLTTHYIARSSNLMTA